jgi:hypothetical protein
MTVDHDAAAIAALTRVSISGIDHRSTVAHRPRRARFDTHSGDFIAKWTARRASRPGQAVL